MMNRPTFSDVYDINPKTGALILGKNRLDDYATKFLNKYCKKALDTPMPLPVNEILKTMKLTVMEASLSRNMDIFGCCLLLDSEVEVFDREEGTSSLVFYPAGTVLLDPASEEMYGEGAKRNTLIHEALHWEKDKTYFEILKVKNALVAEKLYPIMCRHTETFYEPPEGKKTKENEVRWLEWQAHRLAPRILMPVKMFRKKALDLLEVYREPQNDIYPSCDRLIEDLSDFFIVSRSSVKYRLTEVGLIDEICKLEDYDAVFADIHESKEFVALTPVEAYQLLESSSLLQDWVQGGRFVFADGYFVLADAKYIVAKTDGLHLTAKAKKSLQQCVINIREKNYIVYQNFNKDLTGCAFLCRTVGIDQRILTFHPDYQTNFKYEEDDAYVAALDAILEYDEDEEIELLKMLADPRTTLCQCLWFLMEKRKWKYPDKFSEETGLHKNYHGKIKNDKYNNMGKDVLMAICVALRLKLRLIEKIFDKSSQKLNEYQEPDRTYIHILENFPCISLDDFNGLLRVKNLKELGTTIKE